MNKQFSLFCLIVLCLPVFCQAGTIVLSHTSPKHTAKSGSDEQVYGTYASNQVTIESGAQVELINFPGQNTLRIQSSSDLFIVSRSGTVVTLQGSDGTVLKIPATKTVQIIDFTNRESLTLSIHNGKVMLDDQEITPEEKSIFADGGSVSFPVNKNYFGIATIKMIYVDAYTRQPLLTKTKTYNCDVFTSPPKSIPFSSYVETNSVSIDIRTQPVFGDYDGKVHICTAHTAGPGLVSPNLLYQFWNLTVDGNTVNGTMRRTYEDYGRIVFANYLTFRGLTISMYVSQFLGMESTLTGTFTDTKAEITVAGVVKGGMPSYMIIFECTVNATVRKELAFR